MGEDTEMTFEEWELEEITELDSAKERLDYIFSTNQRIEAFASRSAVEPREVVETEGHDRDKARRIVEERASNMTLEKGKSVLAHETRPDWAQNIISEGFSDPFEYNAEDQYHVPESVRYGKVFFWPHVIGVSGHDRSGAVVLCIVDIGKVYVSTYSSFSALASHDFYESLDYKSNKILPKEYNQYHVFAYEDYIEWLESNSEGEGQATLENLLPYRPGN